MHPARGTQEYEFHRETCDTCYGAEMEEIMDQADKPKIHAHEGDCADPEVECYDSDVPMGQVYLDHRCGQWIIGDRKQVSEMITELQVLLTLMP